MYVTQTKSYNSIVSLNDLKQHLRIDENDSTYDAELIRLSKVAIIMAEKYTQADLSATVTLLEDYCINSNCYEVGESNINVIGITGATASDTFIVSDYSVQKFSSYTRIKFNNNVKADTIKIRYSSGYSVGTFPIDIKHAILIKVAELFDVDRQNHIATNIKPSKTFERLLAPYVNNF